MLNRQWFDAGPVACYCVVLVVLQGNHSLPIFMPHGAYAAAAQRLKWKVVVLNPADRSVCSASCINKTSLQRSGAHAAPGG